MEIQSGDFVKIVGNCNRTSIRFKITREMKNLMSNPIAYQVYIPTGLIPPDCVIINGYKWDTADLKLIRKKDGTVIEHDDLSLASKPVSKTSFFKFDEKTLDI